MSEVSQGPERALSQKFMKTILYFQYPWRMSQRRLAGICRFAHKKGWHVQTLEWGRTDFPIRDVLRFWHPVGCIVEGGYVEATRVGLRDFGKVPVVFCDVNPKHLRGRCAWIDHDSNASVSLAFEELWRLGRRTIGFVGTIYAKDWSRRRERHLKALTKVSGGRFDAFVPDADALDVESFLSSLRRWVCELPKPCGIMGANDSVADIVLQACKLASLSVPEDVAVIGIDNDEHICENATPTLSSVELDFERSGYLAAELLDGYMESSRRPAKSAIISYGPSRVVRRGSTFAFVRRDGGVLKAQDLIRSTSGCGLSVASVVVVIGGSRRSAEMRFRALTGQSIGSAIVLARIELAKRLIARDGRAVTSVYAECGYASDVALRRAFKRVTGLSPQAWRDSQSVR